MHPSKSLLSSVSFLAAVLLAPLTNSALADDDENHYAFLVSGDPQYIAEKSATPTKLDPYSEQANSRFIKLIKSLAGSPIPEPLGGGAVSEDILGMLVTGDLIDSADKAGGHYPVMQKFEWARYKSDYGLTGEDGGLPFPVYELHGNHDGPQGDTFIIEDIIERNKTRPGVVARSSNGLHYSWNWGPIHMVNLGMFVGEGDKRREGSHYAPRRSMDFLRQDLAEQVGTSGRPVILAFHLHPNGPRFDWPTEDLAAFHKAIAPYNVVAIFHGHTHGSPPSRMQWAGGKFASEIPGGIDIFNPDDAGAAKTDPRDPAKAVGLLHGFLYVELIDRPGDKEDEFIVRSVATRDNWETHAWRDIWRRNIAVPN
jgi:hypothetical protein